MHHGAMQTVVRNLLHLLQEHGHVPNGSRSYYLNRRYNSSLDSYQLSGCNSLLACIRTIPE